MSLSKLFLTCALLMTMSATGICQKLTPLEGKAAPELVEVVRVRMVTDKGDLLIEVYPEAAPNAAHRFLELVEAGFYDNTPIFRVVRKPEPFVAQFGINSKFPLLENKNFKDDPSFFQMERGTLAFAKDGPDTNSTQVFINYRENNRLTVPERNFSAFGKVVSGMENADLWVPVGDERMGLDQDALWKNTRIVDTMDPKPTMIELMEVVLEENGSTND